MSVHTQGRRNGFWVGGTQVTQSIFGGLNRLFREFLLGENDLLGEFFKIWGGWSPPRSPRFRRLCSNRSSIEWGGVQESRNTPSAIMAILAEDVIDSLNLVCLIDFFYCVTVVPTRDWRYYWKTVPSHTVYRIARNLYRTVTNFLIPYRTDIERIGGIPSRKIPYRKEKFRSFLWGYYQS